MKQFILLFISLVILYSCKSDDDTNKEKPIKVNGVEGVGAFEVFADGEKLLYENISFYKKEDGSFYLRANGVDNEYFRFDFHENANYGQLWLQSDNLNADNSTTLYASRDYYVSESVDFEIVNISEKSIVGEFSGTTEKIFPNDVSVKIFGSFDLPYISFSESINDYGVFYSLNGESFYGFDGFDFVPDGSELGSIRYYNESPYQMRLIFKVDELNENDFIFDNSSVFNTIEFVKFSSDDTSVKYEIIDEGILSIQRIIDVSVDSSKEFIIEGSFSFKVKNPNNAEVIEVVSKQFRGEISK